ncbi:hypothetical protein [Saccharopolyspora phatthalungensis]|uniref:Uncharacterized protein n=1 Tax=Saccharopolyspora phatthalungensis TaxID=664693 RepID=A0A840Q8I5_9PSEU|nr:hypothetical protein [Saccharopolyspora phatthalungensis]MBB5156051.1 hypothetical protein [Saccharopolyspora phatthalungensis]
MVTAAKKQASEERVEQGRQDLAEQIASAILVPVDVARRVLPENGLPVYLGIGALALVDLIDWPVAVAACLGYYVLKRSKPAEPSAISH